MHKELTIGDTPVYHSFPEGDGKYPGLILIEEIWGLNAHIRDLADRFATEGFSVLAPELLPAGLLEILTPELQSDLFDPEKRDEVQPKLRAAMQPITQPEYAALAVNKLKACVDYLLADEHVNGRVAVLGFCFGGTYSFALAADDKRIKAAVPFYGQPLQAEKVKQLRCPVLAFYGEEDAGLMQSLPNLKVEMQKENKDFTAVVYPRAGHAFFNDTNPRMYRPEAAADAWQKTLEFLKKNLD